MSSTDTTAGKIEVMQAFEAGRLVQVREVGWDVWYDLEHDEDESPEWNWAGCHYKVVNTLDENAGDYVQCVIKKEWPRILHLNSAAEKRVLLTAAYIAGYRKHMEEV